MKSQHAKLIESNPVTETPDCINQQSFQAYNDPSNSIKEKISNEKNLTHKSPLKNSNQLDQ